MRNVILAFDLLLASAGVAFMAACLIRRQLSDRNLMIGGVLAAGCAIVLILII